MKLSLRRYEKLLSEADSERVSLLNEITLLSKENYQLRFELSKGRTEDESKGRTEDDSELVRELSAEL